MKCIWCEKRIPRGQETTEHIVPVMFGGEGHGRHCVGNERIACRACNEGRGVLTQAYVRMLQLKDYLRMVRDSRWQPDRDSAERRVARWNAKVPKLLAAQRYWQWRETQRIGWSPSADFIRFEYLDPESIESDVE